MEIKRKLEQQYSYQTKQNLEDITIVNRHAPNIGAPQYIRQLLTAIKEEIDSNTIIVGDFNTPFSSLYHPDRKSIRKKRPYMTHQTRWTQLIFKKHSIQKEQNTLSFQVHMEHSAGQITCWATKEASLNLRKLKSYQASFPTTTLRDYKSITGKKLQKMVQMSWFAGQKLRHRCRQQTYGHQWGETAVGWGWWCAELGDWD